MQSSSNLTTKQLGKVDKAALHKFVVDGYVNIKDLPMENIDSSQAQYFSECTQHNFRPNFKDFTAAFDLELGLARARQEPAEGKMQV
jgi:hypothetical protein